MYQRVAYVIDAHRSNPHSSRPTISLACLVMAVCSSADLLWQAYDAERPWRILCFERRTFAENQERGRCRPACLKCVDYLQAATSCTSCSKEVSTTH